MFSEDSFLLPTLGSLKTLLWLLPEAFWGKQHPLAASWFLPCPTQSNRAKWPHSEDPFKRSWEQIIPEGTPRWWCGQSEPTPQPSSHTPPPVPNCGNWGHQSYACKLLSVWQFVTQLKKTSHRKGFEAWCKEKPLAAFASLQTGWTAVWLRQNEPGRLDKEQSPGEKSCEQWGFCPKCNKLLE